jgi:hypothetical protein
MKKIDDFGPYIFLACNQREWAKVSFPHMFDENWE